MKMTKAWKIFCAVSLFGIASLVIAVAYIGFVLDPGIPHSYYTTYAAAESDRSERGLGQLPAFVPPSSKNIQIYEDVDAEWIEFTYFAEDESKITAQFDNPTMAPAPLPKIFFNRIPSAELRKAAKSRKIWQTPTGETLVIIRDQNKAIYHKQRHG